MILELEFLLMALLRGSLFLAAMMLVAWLIPKHSASFRHALLAIALLSLPAVLPLSMVMPALWQIPVSLPSPSDINQININTFSAWSPSPSSPPQSALLETAEIRADGRVPQENRIDINRLSHEKLQLSKPRLAKRGDSSAGGSSTLVWIWVAGVLVLSARLGAGLYSTQKFLRATTAVSDLGIQNLSRKIAKDFSLSTVPKIVVHSEYHAPLAAGLVRPVIVLPAQAVGWSMIRLEAVLRHELAHIRRQDILIQTAAQLSVILFWYQPLAWLALSQMRREQEKACDDWVVTSGLLPLPYAQELMSLASELFERPTPWLVVEVVRIGSLEDRIGSLLNSANKRDHAPLSYRRLALVLSVGLGMLMLLATVKTAAEVTSASQRVGATQDPAIPLRPMSSPDQSFQNANLRQPLQRSIRHALTVRNESGEPVVEATIFVQGLVTGSPELGTQACWNQSCGDWSRVFQTDRQGQVEIDVSSHQLACLPPNVGPVVALALRIEHDDYAPVQLTNHSLQDHNAITLRNGTIIMPRVIGPEGQSIESDLFVVASGYPAPRWRVEDNRLRSPALEMAPNCPGRVFRVVHFAQESDQVFFSPVVDSSSLNTGARIVQPEIRLSPGVALQGEISRNVPRPIAAGGLVYATVHSQQNEDSLAWFDVAPVTSDGSFQFSSLPANCIVELTALVPGWASHTSIDKLQEFDRQNQTNFEELSNSAAWLSSPVRIESSAVQTIVEMVPTATLELEIVDEHGKPLSGVIVRGVPNIGTSFGSIPLDTFQPSWDPWLAENRNVPRHQASGRLTFTRLSNDLGKVLIENLPLGPQVVECERDNYTLRGNLESANGSGMYVTELESQVPPLARLVMQKNVEPSSPPSAPRKDETNHYEIVLPIFDASGRPAEGITVVPTWHDFVEVGMARWPNEWPASNRVQMPGEYVIRFGTPRNALESDLSHGKLWVDLYRDQQLLFHHHQIDLENPAPIKLR